MTVFLCGDPPLFFFLLLSANNRGMVKSDRIVLAKVGAERENLSPLTDFNINFVDRQTLKVLEDTVIDLQIILFTMLSTVGRIREQCRKCCERYCNDKEKGCDCNHIIEEFDEYVKEVEIYVERSKNLRDMAKSTARLVRLPCLSNAIHMANKLAAIGFTELRRRSGIEKSCARVTAGKQIDVRLDSK
jgi:hypothetical protein